MLNEGNQIHNFISSSGPGTVIYYGSGSDFLTSYGSGSGSTRQKVTVPAVPVPQHWLETTFSDLSWVYATACSGDRLADSSCTRSKDEI